MKRCLEKRLSDLEKQRAEPVKIRFVWYNDPDYDQDNDDPSCIKLKWYDDQKDEP